MSEDNKSCNFDMPLPSRETFKGADPDTKSMYLFDILCVLVDNQDKVRSRLELDRRKIIKFNLGMSGGAGIFGSLLVSFVKSFMK